MEGRGIAKCWIAGLGEESIIWQSGICNPRREGRGIDNLEIGRECMCHSEGAKRPKNLGGGMGEWWVGWSD